jgi:hypothetical protein
MGRGRVSVRVTGVDEVLARLGKQGAEALASQLDGEVERSVRTMANESADSAPYKSGKLAGSIPPSVEQVSPMTWEFGSDVEYATQQEYEHATKKGFFRKSIWNNREPLRKGISEVIRDL